MEHVKARLGHFERRICRELSVVRSTIRYIPRPREDESASTAAVTRLASQYGRYGYRRVHALPDAEGRQGSHSRVLRIWRREGLKVPHKQPKRIRSKEALEVLAELMAEHGVPKHIRSDDGPDMVAEELRDWLEHMGAKTACIEPGSPWENGYCLFFTLVTD